MGPDRCHITGIPDFSDVAYNDPILTGNFFVTAPILGLYYYSESIPFGYLLRLLLQGHQGPPLCFLDF